MLKHFKEQTVEFTDFIREQLSTVLRIIHPNHVIRSDAIELINISNPGGDSGLDIQESLSLMHKNSGLEVILFIELARTIIEEQLASGKAVMSDTIMKLARQSRIALGKEKIDSERKSIIGIFQSLADQEKSKMQKYLHEVSKLRYGSAQSK